MAKATIFDVAKAFLTMESMTHKKLQKLCYYAQAWHLALKDERLVDCNFEAWIHGPVCPELYHEYRDYGWNPIPMEPKVPDVIDDETWEFLEMVYEAYGELTGDELEELSHSEEPWIAARGELQEWQASHNVISEELMKKYYRRVYEANAKN
ncbi:type II toxin-antitoxin system antitoxin SocA domain-containing protein [Moorellaceae bacterium AZ2]